MKSNNNNIHHNIKNSLLSVIVILIEKEKKKNKIKIVYLNIYFFFSYIQFLYNLIIINKGIVNRIKEIMFREKVHMFSY